VPAARWRRWSAVYCRSIRSRWSSTARWLTTTNLDKACDIQIAAQACGKLILPPAEVCAYTEQQFNNPNRALEAGELTDVNAMQLAWAALLRRLDRVSPGYRD
jgi:hypothetical protein